MISMHIENETDIAWIINVSVIIGSTKTKHKITLKKDYFENFKNKYKRPEDLVKKSFEFLLERESNKNILKEFDLKLIQQYFPEYENTI